MLSVTSPLQRSEGNGELILLVDDVEAIRGITKTILETFGHRVILACDGAEAVATSAKHSFPVGRRRVDGRFSLRQNTQFSLFSLGRDLLSQSVMFKQPSGQ